jgi:SAM-dependent methyltransferase
VPYAPRVDLGNLEKNWDALGRADPMWAILADPLRRGNRWEQQAFFRSGRDHVDAALARLDELGMSPHRGRALDFGSGVGRLSQALVCHFDDVDGVDIAESMIGGARTYNRYGDRARYHVNTRDDLSLFEDGSFDFVLRLIVLQHMENRYKARYLAEFVRLLRPGGAAILTVPSHPALTARGLAFRLVPNRLLNVYRRRRYGVDGVMELHGMRRSDVEHVLLAAGARAVITEPDALLGTPWVSYRYTVRR